MVKRRRKVNERVNPFKKLQKPGKAFNIVEYAKEQTKREEKKEKNKRKEKVRIEIAEAWDSIPLAQVVRGCMLLTQSIFRKSILLPLLIITKNIGRILLFELPEWAEERELLKLAYWKINRPKLATLF